MKPRAPAYEAKYEPMRRKRSSLASFRRCLGRSGTATYPYEGIAPAGQPFHATWVLVGGTGSLTPVNGRGTFGGNSDGVSGACDGGIVAGGCAGALVLGLYRPGP